MYHNSSTEKSVRKKISDKFADSRTEPLPAKRYVLLQNWPQRPCTSTVKRYLGFIFLCITELPFCRQVREGGQILTPKASGVPLVSFLEGRLQKVATGHNQRFRCITVYGPWQKAVGFVRSTELIGEWMCLFSTVNVSCCFQMFIIILTV